MALIRWIRYVWRYKIMRNPKPLITPLMIARETLAILGHDYGKLRIRKPTEWSVRP